MVWSGLHYGSHSGRSPMLGPPAVQQRRARHGPAFRAISTFESQKSGGGAVRQGPQGHRTKMSSPPLDPPLDPPLEIAERWCVSGVQVHVGHGRGDGHVSGRVLYHGARVRRAADGPGRAVLQPEVRLSAAQAHHAPGAGAARHAPREESVRHVKHLTCEDRPTYVQPVKSVRHVESVRHMKSVQHVSDM